jgi:hypothetical protein
VALRPQVPHPWYRRKVEQGEKLSRVPLHSVRIPNYTLNLWRASYGEILIFIWGRLLSAKF